MGSTWPSDRTPRSVSSPDGITWTARKIPTEGVELWRPAAGDAGFLAVGAGGTRLVSKDLVDWSGRHTTADAFYGVGSDGTGVVAAGVNGIVARLQEDGDWETRRDGPSALASCAASPISERRGW